MPNLVYAATGHEVDLVMVDGRILVRGGRVLAVDEAAVREEVQQRAHEVADAVKRDPIHLDMALLQAMEEGKL